MLQAWQADITRLMVLAYPKDDLPLSRRDYFLTALGDSELEIKVHEWELPDLQAVYKTAIWLEMLKKASSARDAETAAAPKEAAKPSKGTRVVQELTEQMNLDGVKKILWQMKEWHTEKQHRIEELEAENLRLHQNSQAKPTEPVAVDTSTFKPAEGNKKDYSNMTSFTCGQKGHTSVVCRKKSGRKTGPA